MFCRMKGEAVTEYLETPWKAWNLAELILYSPIARLQFALNGIAWGEGWRFYRTPIVQKHRHSSMVFGANLQLRSSLRSNPLGASHPVMLCTWQQGAKLIVGSDFAMTGGALCAAQHIEIGNRVRLGANTTITDTDFHPLAAGNGRPGSSEVRTDPVFIEDDVFIGMNSLILKGVRIGRGSVIGAGSVVTGEIAPGVVAAGNPARVIRTLL